jgi:hypothetical protein
MMVDRPTLQAAGILDPPGQAAYACFVKEATKVAPAVYSPVFAFKCRRPKSVEGANARREEHGPPCPQFRRTAGTRSLPHNHRGRGTVLRARLFGGTRRPVGAQSSAPVFVRTARTPSLPPKHHGRGTVLCARKSGGPHGSGPSQTTINHRGRGTVLRARLFGGTRRPGGAQSFAPVFQRTARTPSLPCLWRNTAHLSVSSVSPW